MCALVIVLLRMVCNVDTACDYRFLCTRRRTFPIYTFGSLYTIYDPEEPASGGRAPQPDAAVAALEHPYGDGAYIENS